MHDGAALPPQRGPGRPEIAPGLGETYRRVRAATVGLAAPLSPEDQVVQSMPDASPVKWHLAHTTWFFETFVLAPYVRGWKLFDERWGFLFNSYYDAVGARHPRPRRGLLTRPSVDDVRAYRAYVDEGIDRLLRSGDPPPGVAGLVVLGIHHEQQHQELLLTDILHAFSCNPLRPPYRNTPEEPGPTAEQVADEPGWIAFEAGLVEIGHTGPEFAFDNEGPRHPVHLRPFRLADRLVTNGEWREFILDGGYRRPELWLSDGWATVQAEGWCAPLHWEDESADAGEGDGDGLPSRSMTLAGLRPLVPAAPVCHVSFYEADAFARWAGKRLPTEAEWETAAAALPLLGNLRERGELRPVTAPRPGADVERGPTVDGGEAVGRIEGGGEGGVRQMFGDVWEWTGSAYAPYPGFRPAAGAVGEYNGKFMCNQMVLRGGSCLTPVDHVRATYRNFFYPHQRWQFSGLRLAEDA